MKPSVPKDFKFILIEIIKESLYSLKNTVFKLKKKLNILLLCILASQALFAQSRISDNQTGEGLPFSTVINLTNPKEMTVSDINGYFKLSPGSSGDSILIRCVGYDSLRTIYYVSDTLFRLRHSDKILAEAVITANDAPAIRIIKKVLRNREKLDIRNLHAYQCLIYTKNTIGFDTDQDSISIREFNTTTSYPSTFFISESVIQRQYVNRDKICEKVLASNTSGMETAQFAILPEAIQSLNFYNDYITIFSKDYVNPISQLSWVKYHFNLDKEYQENGDTLYKIDFWPKSKSNNCFKGMLIISNNQWAVQKVRMESATDEIYPFVLHQEYANTAGHWFPLKFIAEIKFPSAIGKNFPFIIHQESSFKNVAFENIKLHPGKTNKTIFAENSNHNIDSLRFYSLSSRDSLGYTFGNYLYKETPLGFLMKNMQSFVNYQIPIGPIAIDYLKLYQSNLFEKHRFSLSFATNMERFPHLHLGGYVAYGTQDKQWKYGGSAGWYFDDLRTTSILYSYTHDVEGNKLFRDRNLWYNRYYSNLFSEIERHQIVFNRIHATHNLTAGINREEYNPRFEYQFHSNEGYLLNKYIIAEAFASYRYFKARQVNFFNTYFIVKNPDYPIIEINYRQGILGLLNSTFNYQSLELNFNKVFRWVLIGNTEITAQGGILLGHTPIFKLFNAPASLTGSLTLQAPASFQTMQPNVYFSNRFFHFFLEQSIKKLYATRFSSPELFVSYNAGWGKLTTATDHSLINLKDYANGYHEVGLGFNSIIRIPIYDWFAFGINVGGYYHFQSGLPIHLGKNAVIKLGIGFLF